MSQLLIAAGRPWPHPAPRHPAHDQTHNYCPKRPLQPGIALGSHRCQDRKMHTIERSNFPTTGCASRRRVETLNRYILKSWQFGVRCSALGVRYSVFSSLSCPLSSVLCPLSSVLCPLPSACRQEIERIRNPFAPMLRFAEGTKVG